MPSDEDHAHCRVLVVARVVTGHTRHLAEETQLNKTSGPSRASARVSRELEVLTNEEEGGAQAVGNERHVLQGLGRGDR
jgi:hypothetical protein